VLLDVSQDEEPGYRATDVFRVYCSFAKAPLRRPNKTVWCLPLGASKRVLAPIVASNNAGSPIIYAAHYI